MLKQLAVANAYLLCTSCAAMRSGSQMSGKLDLYLETAIRPAYPTFTPQLVQACQHVATIAIPTAAFLAALHRIPASASDDCSSEIDRANYADFWHASKADAP